MYVKSNLNGLLEALFSNNIHFNLSVPELIEQITRRKEGEITSTGAIKVTTGKYTGRSPGDKFIVKEKSVSSSIDWGPHNQCISEEEFNCLLEKTKRYLKSKELFVFDGFAGADRSHRFPIRIINEVAWHNLFVHQMLIRPTPQELGIHEPEFTIIALPELLADPSSDGTKSEAFIIISFEKKIVLIGGTRYAGEMKKSIFSVLNFLLPLQGVLPMHCSANVGEHGDTALFFGLSGTGKTTLSTHPFRRLIGDDEHGWSDHGVFNFEGGCYAKCANLSEEREPQIWNAIRFGSVLENVTIDPVTRSPIYGDVSLTENTRAAYPIDFIPNAVIPGVAGHPKVIIFLTADAFGVLPPVSKLTREQGMYHFLSGYTSKLAGTEREVHEPVATFSACFGAPFLPHRPSVYAELLGEKISRHDVRVYLVNTGWSGGPFGIGKRIDLSYTRAIVDSILDGSIEQTEYHIDPVFGIQVPSSMRGVPYQILQPVNAWEDQNEYMNKAAELVNLFAKNFEKIPGASQEMRRIGPTV